MKRIQFFCLQVGAALCFTAGNALAIDVPRSVEANEMERQMKTRPVPAEPVAKEAVGKAVVEAPKGAENVLLHLNDIEIEGSHAYTKDQLLPLYGNLLGKDVSLSDVYKIVSKIQQYYLDNGYVLVNVFLPPQEIANGKVRIRVAEGYVARVKWVGAPIDSDLVKKLGERLSSMRPFNGKQLEEVMLLLNELPSVKAQSVIGPYKEADAKDGAVELQIIITRDYLHASAGVNSFASRHLGVWQEHANVDIDSVLAEIDRLSLTGSLSLDPKYSRYVRAEYSLPVHESGTTLRFGSSFSKSVPGFTLETSDIRSRARNHWVGVSQPILRSREQSLTLESQFTLNNQTTDALGALFYEDRVRTLSLSASYSNSDDWQGSNLAILSVVQGLDILDETKTGSANLSRARGHSDFTRLNLDLSRLQNLNQDFSMLASASGQMSNAPLLSSEQFGFGGIAFGRAYDSSEISGDSGVAASLELRYRYLSLAENMMLQPFMFYDIGKVWNRIPGGDVLSAASAGAGLRFQFATYAKAEFMVAKPLTAEPTIPKFGAEGDDPRISFSFNLAY